MLNSSANSSSASRGPDPYTTLPQITTDYIQLRFQLARFEVHRIVRLPLAFTFANLHTLIQYMFGWSNSHLHQAEVFPNVVLHSDKKLPGTIKSCGRKRPLEDYELGDALAIDHWKRFEMADRPIYRVQPKVRQRKDEFDSIMTMEDKILTLESIWTPNEKNNVSDGECSNAEVGIVYVYDLGDEWTVHITCEQGKIFYRADVPSNLPVITDAAGAPPIEHASGDVFGEEDAEDKTVSPRLFDASQTEEKRREYLLRQKEKQERIANGEQEEEDEESDEEY